MDDVLFLIVSSVVAFLWCPATILLWFLVRTSFLRTSTWVRIHSVSVRNHSIFMIQFGLSLDNDVELQLFGCASAVCNGQYDLTAVQTQFEIL